MGLPDALRCIGGVPTYLLTDNERTVTVHHVAGVAVRNSSAVEFGPRYGHGGMAGRAVSARRATRSDARDQRG
jgi:transposase